MSDRIRKVNELLKNRVSEAISRAVSFKPGTFLTVSKVSTTPDLKKADIYVSIFPESDQRYVLKTLENERHHITGNVQKDTVLRTLPKLRFLYDDTEVHANEVEKILLSLKKEQQDD